MHSPGAISSHEVDDFLQTTHRQPEPQRSKRWPPSSAVRCLTSRLGRVAPVPRGGRGPGLESRRIPPPSKLEAAAVAWPIHLASWRAHSHAESIRRLTPAGTRTDRAAALASRSASAFAERSVAVREDPSLNSRWPTSSARECAGIHSKSTALFGVIQAGEYDIPNPGVVAPTCRCPRTTAGEDLQQGKTIGPVGGAWEGMHRCHL